MPSGPQKITSGPIDLELYDTSLGVEDESLKEVDSFFPEHWDPKEIEQGLKNGELYQGKFAAKNDSEGYVLLNNSEEANKKSVRIHGKINLNRCIHNDTVAVKLLISPAVWDFNKINEENEPEGCVVGILERNSKPYSGILLASSKTAVFYFFLPQERKIPKIRVKNTVGEDLITKYLTVRIDSWPKDSKYPKGHIIDVVGEIGERKAEKKMILLKYNITHDCFKQEILKSLPTLPWIPQDSENVHRKDLRYLPICSIDPEGCTDIDDALHCQILENGLFEVGVHIADVSYFVRPNTLIDTEAYNRGTTVYLIDQRIDMLPGVLSSNICSLKEKEDRLAFSTLWEMSSEADIIQTKFFKSIINSKAAFSYTEAQRRIDDESLSDHISLSLKNLNRIAKILKKKRMEKGAIFSSNLEVDFIIDPISQDPVAIKQKDIFESHGMVEEFMLLANFCAAKKIISKFPDTSLLRHHPTPVSSNFDNVIKAASAINVEMKMDSSKNIALSLESEYLKNHPHLNFMLRRLTTRSLDRAAYICSGYYLKKDYSHFALAAELYTHFTSPIRRYADLIVHRLLAASIGIDEIYPDLLDKRKIGEICAHLNERSREANGCARASQQFHTKLYIKNFNSLEEDGYIISIKKKELGIFVPPLGLECSLYLNKKKDVNFEYNHKERSIKSGSISIKYFDPVRVKLSVEKRQLQDEKIFVELVYPYIPNFSVQPSSEPAFKRVKLE